MARKGAGPGQEDDRAPTLWDRVEYLLVRAFAFPFLCTDLHGATHLGRALGRFAAAVDGRHRRTTEENLRRAYGAALTDAQVRRLALRVYERIGVTAAEFLHGTRRFRGRAARRWFVHEGVEELRASLGGKPVIFLGAHLGNWEHLVPAILMAGFDVVSVARVQDNPLLDRWVGELRGALGNVPIMKEGALRGMMRALKEGRPVGMLVDQGAGRHGRIAQFFGRPCSTQVGGITLARRMGVPFSIATLERRSPGFHRLVMGPPVYVRDDDASEQEAVQEMNRQLEERVRRRPADWMWLHRKWRIKAEWGFPVEPTEGKRKP